MTKQKKKICNEQEILSGDCLLLQLTAFLFYFSG